jgi:hypothetical protein
MKYVKFLLVAVLAVPSFLQAKDLLTPEAVIGKYACTFTQDGYTYDPFTCVIKKVDQDLILEKISGSQRIKGKIQLTAEGFEFDGSYFCPYGDCTSPAKGKFTQVSASVYEGPVNTENPASETLVKLVKK